MKLLNTQKDVKDKLIELLNWLDDYSPRGLPEEVVDVFLEDQYFNTYIK